MKRFILLSIITIAFASCNKCYQCTITTQATGQASSTTSTEFCGTKKQKDAYVASGTQTTKTTVGGVQYTQSSRTTCN